MLQLRAIVAVLLALLASGCGRIGFEAASEDAAETADASAPDADGGAPDSTLAVDGSHDAFVDALADVPESSLPESSLPESSLPESSVPESSVPESSVPEVGDAPQDGGIGDEGDHPDAPPPPVTIGGTVVGLAAGASVTLEDNGQDSVMVTNNGPFVFASPLTPGASYAVTVGTQPNGPTQDCVVSGSMGIAPLTNVTSVTVVCTTVTVAVGGTLLGLAAGDTIVLQDNGGDDLMLSANGAFTFASPLPSGDTYLVSVSVQPADPLQSCLVSAGAGTVQGAAVTSIVVNCSTNTFTVGGTVAGLAAEDVLVLSNDGGPGLFITSNGSFTFPASVASGTAYTVAVMANPVAPVAQLCTVQAGTGTVTTMNVTGVKVTCIDDCGTLSVNMESSVGSVDHFGVVAIANGTPDVQMGLGSPNALTAEATKTWYTINNYIPMVANAPVNSTLCVPPGNYTIQFWDIWGAGGGFDNGTPPTVTYVWQLGNSSKTVAVAVGSVVTVDVGVLESNAPNVPTNDNFYGSWVDWDYGPCAGGCPSGTTCYNSLCYDMGYSVSSCGTGGNACAGLDCCDSNCVDTTSDPNNCGGCGYACGQGVSCVSSVCQ